jgi:formyltetrahydrofolate deformylase
VEKTILKLSCPDQPGLVARLTQFIAGKGGNLLEMQQFTDQISGWFFTHMVWDSGSVRVSPEEFRTQFEPLARELNADWNMRQESTLPRVVLLVSKELHCLADLLQRWKRGELPIEILAVAGNHPHPRQTVEQAGLRFVHLPVDRTNKAEHFARIGNLLDELEPDLVVLARYMQIIPPDLCQKWAGRMMNIHHSFLPAFAGANPYQRAFERGVKVIGATCHYVTEDLDEGPIITQEIAPVEHYHTPDDLLRLGRDCERLALARGVRYHVKERVLIHGRKTVVFRD